MLPVRAAVLPGSPTSGHESRPGSGRSLPGPASRTHTLALALSAINRGRLPSFANLLAAVCQSCEGCGRRRFAYADRVSAGSLTWRNARGEQDLCGGTAAQAPRGAPDEPGRAGPRPRHLAQLSEPDGARLPPAHRPRPAPADRDLRTGPELLLRARHDPSGGRPARGAHRRDRRSPRLPVRPRRTRLPHARGRAGPPRPGPPQPAPVRAPRGSGRRPGNRRRDTALTPRGDPGLLLPPPELPARHRPRGRTPRRGDRHPARRGRRRPHGETGRRARRPRGRRDRRPAAPLRRGDPHPPPVDPPAPRSASVPHGHPTGAPRIRRRTRPSGRRGLSARLTRPRPGPHRHRQLLRGRADPAVHRLPHGGRGVPLRHRAPHRPLRPRL